MFIEDITNKKQLNELYLKLMEVAKATGMNFKIECPSHESTKAIQNVAKYFMCFICELRLRELHKTENLWTNDCEEIYQNMVDPFIKMAWTKGVIGSESKPKFH